MHADYIFRISSEILHFDISLRSTDEKIEWFFKQLVSEIWHELFCIGSINNNITMGKGKQGQAKNMKKLQKSV